MRNADSSGRCGQAVPGYEKSSGRHPERFMRMASRRANEWEDAVHIHVGAARKVAIPCLDFSLHTALNGVGVAASEGNVSSTSTMRRIEWTESPRTG